MVTWNDGRRLRLLLSLGLGCLLAAALALAAAGWGQGESEAAPAPQGQRAEQQVVRIDPVEDDRWTYARARFREMCAGCHTFRDARATGPRYDLDVVGDITEPRARFAIAYGEPGMPHWRDVLSRREFEELVLYVSTMERQTTGDDHWGWQLKMRAAGEGWRPEDPR